MKKFLKNWWEVFALIIVIILLRTYVFSPILVDGHSMDPTLEDRERMIMVKISKIQRFDIVVSNEPEEPGKNIIKRVIGMPGDTIEFDNDQLKINGKKYSEPYLDSFKKKFAEDKLQSEYSYDPGFQMLAQQAAAFTVDANGNAKFTVKVPKDSYFLMGDDRIVSKDSREIGAVKKTEIQGEAKLAYWPINKFKLIK